jgi:hypothetical protein
MTESLYNLKIFRRENGVPMPAAGSPDAQANALCDAVRAYATSIAPAAPTPEGLEEFLQNGFPGSVAQAVDEYVWYLDPTTGRLVKVCIDDEVVVTQQQNGAHAPQVIDPEIVVSFQNEMT